jgi:hypothetical protein
MVRSGNRSLFSCRRGYAGIIATIFLVLVVMYLYYNFTLAQNQNVQLQDATSQSQQLDIDRNSEHLILNTGNCTYGGGTYSITLNVTNASPIPVQLVRLWAVNAEHEYSSKNVTFVMQPGEELPPQVFDFHFAGSTSEVTVWFVTARGNLVSASVLVV